VSDPHGREAIGARSGSVEVLCCALVSLRASGLPALVAGDPPLPEQLGGFGPPFAHDKSVLRATLCHPLIGM
jgi:hypothetical protein